MKHGASTVNKPRKFSFRLIARIAAAGTLINGAAFGDFADWQQVHFGLNAPLEMAGPLADPDGDGLSNAIEYATGSDPSKFSLSPTAKVVDGNLALQFHRAKLLTDVGIFGEVVENITTAQWHSGSLVSIYSIADEGASELVTLRSTFAPNLYPKAFMRLKVVFANTDGDNDGVFDLWEMSMYGDLSKTGVEDSDGDGVPDREDADPHNASIGRMNISITSPANNSIIP